MSTATPGTGVAFVNLLAPLPTCTWFNSLIPGPRPGMRRKGVALSPGMWYRTRSAFAPRKPGLSRSESRPNREVIRSHVQDGSRLRILLRLLDADQQPLLRLLRAEVDQHGRLGLGQVPQAGLENAVGLLADGPGGPLRLLVHRA